MKLKAKVNEAAWLKEKERKDKEIADAVTKKKQQKGKKEKKEKKKAKAVMESGSEREVRKVAEIALAEEEKGTDGNTKGEKPGISKERALQKLKEVHNGKQRVTAPAVTTVETNKRKQAPKSSSVVESREEGTSGPSKWVKLEVMGPAQGEEEFMRNSKWSSLAVSSVYWSGL